MAKEVCVMLVDHDKEFVSETITLLQSYEYKVRTANIASEGMSMLSKRKEKIDVMIININSPDLLSFRLLAQAVALDIVTIFVCDEYNASLAKKAFEDGVYLYLQKPLHQEIIKYLWQFVVTKNIQKKRAREELEESGDQETQRGPKFSFPPHNSIFAREESSTLHQVCHPTLQDDPQYLSPFDDSFLSLIENNNVGGLQRQYGDLVGILGSQGSNIGSTYYRPGLKFNDGDHHAQNDYNLNIATYSVMSDTDNGNATTNSLGVANANCCQYVGETSMSHPNNIVTTTHANENEGSESNEIDCDAYIDFSNMDDLFQKIESPSSKLPTEHGSEFD